MRSPSALRTVPDKVVFAVGVHRVLKGRLDVFAQKQLVDGIPEHTPGVDRVDVVGVAHDGRSTGGKERVRHRTVRAAVSAAEFARLRQDDGAVHRLEEIRTAEEIRRDGVQTVDLNDAVAEQVDAVPQVFVGCGFLGQQNDRLGGDALPEKTVRVGVVCAVRAQDAQVILTHLFQVGDGNGGVQPGVHAQRRPEALHIRIVRITGTVDRVVKGVVDHGCAKFPGTGLGGEGRDGQLVRIKRSRKNVLVVQIIQQDAAPDAAGVRKADHLVFGVHADGTGVDKPFVGQFVQLFQCGVLPLFEGHCGIFIAFGQGGHGFVRLLHLLGVFCRQCLRRTHTRLLRKGRDRHSGRDKNNECKKSAQETVASFIHVVEVLPRERNADGKYRRSGRFLYAHFRESGRLCQAFRADFAKLSQERKFVGTHKELVKSL